MKVKLYNKINRRITELRFTLFKQVLVRIKTEKIVKNSTQSQSGRSSLVYIKECFDLDLKINVILNKKS